jgi:hypothetical protein
VALGGFSRCLLRAGQTISTTPKAVVTRKARDALVALAVGAVALAAPTAPSGEPGALTIVLQGH